MVDLKSYFHDKYKGGEDFVENVILPIFGEDKYDDAYEEDVLENNPELTTMASTIGISQILRLGTINIPMNPTDVFDITVSSHVQMERNRVSIQSLVRRIMSTFSSAFMIFHYEDDTRWDWRFSFCSKLGNNQDSTDSKRYTFLLGPNQSCRTAADNFTKLAGKRGNIALEDIVKAFDVEALSKEFFEKYKVRYGRFVDHVIGKDYVDKGEGKGEWKDNDDLQPSELFYELGENGKLVRDYIKKLLGRIVFLHFLQKKGWLGSTDEHWTNGSQDFMLQLFNNATEEQKEDFLDGILEPLFSCLDTPLNLREEMFDTKVEGLRSVRVPFLGGLFERTEEDNAVSVFPSELFADLFKFLSEYNFTIDENDPNDAQVGVDPEMLGRIFENLLEDNKDKGAFYTPKEIVQYMCRESLIAYLQTDVTDEATREALRQFVTTHDVSTLGGKDSALAKNVSQCLQDVKICDPAIGSGAFPMGLLNELFICRGVIEDFENAADIKSHIIQNNIYGVDIEKGAVDIARLRFWLSLITDAKKPSALPNMDFKIMQGNSLLEQYKGFDLSRIMETKQVLHAGHQFQLFEDDVDVIRAEIKNTINQYFLEHDHEMRRTMRKSIQDKIQMQMGIQGVTVDISDIKDIAANDQFFLWHTWFSDVFEDGGFDIVIGNPPYISIQGMTPWMKTTYKATFEFFFHRYDLFACFIEFGMRIAKGQGILSFIQPSVFLNSKSFMKCRKYLVEDCTLMRLNLLKDGVFDSAIVPTMIMQVRKELGKAQHIICTQESLTEEYTINQDSFRKTEANVFNMNLDETVAKFIEKTEKGCVMLGEIAKVTNGINTGNLSAYLLTEHAVGYMPVLKGGAVSKWVFNYQNHYLKNSLDEFVSCGDLDTLTNEKLMMKRIGIYPNVCYDNSGIACLHTIHTIRILDSSYASKYIMALMNSKLIGHIFRLRVPLKGDVFPEFRVFDLNQQIPIKSISIDKQNSYVDLVDRILSAKKSTPQADTTDLEREIDRLVYDLYGLTEDEIRIVEGAKL